MTSHAGALDRDQSALRFSSERRHRNRLINGVALIGKRQLAQYTDKGQPSNSKDRIEMRITRNCPLPGPETERSGARR